MLIKKIIKVKVKALTWAGSVGTHPFDQLATRALVLLQFITCKVWLNDSSIYATNGMGLFAASN
jgi:hypothetical protein